MDGVRNALKINGIRLVGEPHFLVIKGSEAFICECLRECWTSWNLSYRLWLSFITLLFNKTLQRESSTLQLWSDHSFNKYLGDIHSVPDADKKKKKKNRMVTEKHMQSLLSWQLHCGRLDKSPLNNRGKYTVTYPGNSNSCNIMYWDSKSSSGKVL